MAREYKVVVTETGDKRLILKLYDDMNDYIEVWLRDSKENGGLEGYTVIVNWKLNMQELYCWNKNIFGRGLYAEEMAEKHFIAVCNCIINGYEKCRENINRTKRKNFVKMVREHLSREMNNIRAKVDQENDTVKVEPIGFRALFNFEKQWGN